MIKKLLALSAAFLILAGCSGEKPTESFEGKNILVAYYSAQNHTKGVAEVIADELNADIFVITPKEPYTNDDLNWTDDNSRVNTEHDDPNRHIAVLHNQMQYPRHNSIHFYHNKFLFLLSGPVDIGL